jgi:hypothetical protein
VLVLVLVLVLAVVRFSVRTAKISGNVTLQSEAKREARLGGSLTLPKKLSG